ncbi:MAG: DUF2461 domain-containing protein [Myxococcaceae bacterium]|nr:DUF2461 domain-containing protein [Myxococcaceae bacterium]
MAFEGFTKQGDAFFAQLAGRQDRDWFKAHRDEFKAHWEEPMKALLEELKGPIGKQYRGVALKPPKVFRIYRDVRFSNDKSPFKTYVASMIGFPGGEEVGAPAAVYVSFGSENLVAAGHWALPPDKLKRYRGLVADAKTGPVLQKKVDVLLEKGFKAEAMEATKRVPPGFDADHPRAALLKQKGLGFVFPEVPKAVRYSPKLAGWIIEQSKHVAPVVTWLEDRLS